MRPRLVSHKPLTPCTAIEQFHVNSRGIAAFQQVDNSPKFGRIATQFKRIKCANSFKPKPKAEITQERYSPKCGHLLIHPSSRANIHKAKLDAENLVSKKGFIPQA